VRISPEKLAVHSKSTLQPIYMIYGDEPLLHQEAADIIRQAARQQGFSNREIHIIEKNNDWTEILASTNSLSLFGDRNILEVRFTNKPDTEAVSVLEKYASNPSPDTLLLLLLPKLDAIQQKAKWFTACDNVGVSVQIATIDSGNFPEWLSGRLQQAGLSGDQETFQLLIDRLEGNLLAAIQEIEKLRLIAAGGRVTTVLVRQSVGDSSRYNIYDLADAALKGDIGRAIRMLSGLRAEGESESSLLWVLAKDARVLAALREGVDAGQHPSALFQQNGVWQKRQGLFQAALRHTSPAIAQQIIQECLAADSAIKGQSLESADDVLLRLCLLMAGRPLFTAALS
jgi:DNA polymerase-3 subunit delta